MTLATNRLPDRCPARDRRAPRLAHAQKIGVVDMQRALNETEDGRKAKDTLKKLFEQRQKMLDKQQNDLKALKESLEKQRDVLSRDVLAKKARGVPEGVRSSCRQPTWSSSASSRRRKAS